MNCSKESPELLAQQLRQAHRNAITAELAASGLQEIGHPVLLCILRGADAMNGGQVGAQRDLAELLNISPAAVASSLKSLEKSGYLRREPGQGDARRNRVIITDKGRRAVEVCLAAFDKVSRRMMAGFTQEEREQMTRFNSRMLHNLLEGEMKNQPERMNTDCSNCS